MSLLETVITLRECTELVEVKKFYNSLEIGSEKITAEDLLACFMDTADDSTVAKRMLNMGNCTEVLERLVEELPASSTSVILKAFLQNVYSYQKPEDLIELFGVIAQRMNIEELDEKGHTILLQKMINSVMPYHREPKSTENYSKLLDLLLEKIRIVDTKGTLTSKYLKQFVQRAEKEEDQESIQAMFFELAKKAKPSWIRKVLAPFLKKQKVVITPILPDRCVMYQELLDGTQIVVLKVDAHRRKTLFHHDTFEEVGYPGLLFEMHVQEGKCIGARIYAVKDRVIKPTSKLYRYPFSNVSREFLACWPDLRGTEANPVSRISMLPEAFLDSRNNDHWFWGKNLREMFHDLQHRDFDLSILEDLHLTVEEQFELNALKKSAKEIKKQN